MRFVSSNSPLSRRNFLRLGAFAVTGAAIGRLSAQESPASGQNPELRPILKSLKIGMVNVEGSLTDKFRAAREAGFEGIELNSPGINVDDAKKAIAESGLPVDGTVCSTHWRIRHSDPDPEIRAQALKDLQEAIRQTRSIGGHTVLLVPAHGQDGTPEEVWERSFENIDKALPLAAEHGIVIGMENVHNHFLYEHGGPAGQTADEFCKYVDAFRSPWVGMQYDIGNHQEYGEPADWIRTLGKRIVKLDVKDWSRENGWVAIGDGDVNWANVRQALADIGYTGWAAAEVRGGNLEQLKTVSRQMDEAFALGG